MYIDKLKIIVVALINVKIKLGVGWDMKVSGGVNEVLLFRCLKRTIDLLQTNN